MSNTITPPELQQTDILLSELFKEVQQWEGSLAGGTELGVGAEAINSLLESKVSFGNPKDSLILLTEETFKDTGTELDNFYKQQMRDKYDFYYLTISVALIPKPATRFWRLTCKLNFTPKGEKEPMIHKIFPNDKWRSVMNFGVGMDVGLNGNLDWNVGVDSSQLPAFKELLPGEIKANVANKDKFNGFIAIPAFKYELGHPEILAVGENNSFCYWRIEDQELQKIGTAKFAVIFKVPKETQSINLEGIAWAEPDINWLTADLRDVFRDLSDNLKSLLQQKNQAASRFARGEQWTLTLPKASHVS